MIPRPSPTCRWGSFVFLLILAAVVAPACQDTLVRSLSSQNNPQEYVQPDSFRFQATELDNVTDERTWNWTNTGTTAVVMHRSFVHHGHGRIVLLDAARDTVYDVATLENNLDNESTEGAAGAWTIILQLYGAKGRVDVSIIKKP